MNIYAVDFKLLYIYTHNMRSLIHWMVVEFVVNLLKWWIELCFQILIKKALMICLVILDFNKSYLMVVLICARWLVYCVNIHPGGPRFYLPPRVCEWSDPRIPILFLTRHSSLLYFTHTVKSDYFYSFNSTLFLKVASAFWRLFPVILCRQII